METKWRSLAVMILLTMSACGQSPAKHKPDPAAIQLNYQAMTLVRYLENADSARKAIALLDQATTIDSNYFLGYENKIMFYFQLKQFDKALLANNKMIQLKPGMFDVIERSGLFNEFLGDSVAAKKYFTEALNICNSVLDTMSQKNSDYLMLISGKAMNLLMLGDSARANDFLKDASDKLPSDPILGKAMRESLELFMGKNKTQLLDILKNPEKYEQVYEKGNLP